MIQGQGGSTLIELLVAMPIAIVLLGLVVQSLGRASTDQRDIERRSQALSNGQIALDRMTSEIRGADWVYFRSSSIVDMDTHVRATPTSHSVLRLVRYDCSGEVCIRSEGPATTYPPPAAPSFAASRIVIGSASTDLGGLGGQITAHDIFRPTRVDPATGASTVDFLNPDYLTVRLSLKVKSRPDPTVLEDGVSLRNLTGYTG